MQNRLQEYKGDAKKAFSDLDKNPIWLNEKEGIAIKRVTISGVANAEPLHYKKDHFGHLILDEYGNKQAVDFVSTGNNHHVAIYEDDKGKLQEKVVPFFEAVERARQGLPVIDKSFYTDLGWKFLFTLKQNEYFIFPDADFQPNEIDLMNPDNYHLISPHLFRVQKLSTKNYVFNHHFETKAVDGELLKNRKELTGITYYFIQTPLKLKEILKVRLNHLGKIVQIGEY